MLSAELDLAHLDARHWTNWWRLLVPPRVLAQPAWALAIVDGSALAKVIVTGRGVIDPAPALGGLDGASLAAFARALGVAAVVAIERGVIRELSAEIEGALGIEQDLVEQGLVALRALKKRAGHGVWTEPPLLELLPAPSYEPIQRTFDLLVPDASALVAYVIDDEQPRARDGRRVHASIIAVKEDGDIARAATHRGIADLVPEAAFARDWQKGVKRVLEAVEDRYAKPSIGLFLERATLRRILTGPSDQLARELNNKQVVIDPSPAWLLGLLGGAAVARVAGQVHPTCPRGAQRLGGCDRVFGVDGVRRADAHQGCAAGGKVRPLELWSRVKHSYRE
ncbi:MAG: hypothetical protein KIT31_00380 [Deltaproteobacteria bacterium]|nr:hypothetical protein [Deltaproteobacteria bacterium]